MFDALETRTRLYATLTYAYRHFKCHLVTVYIIHIHGAPRVYISVHAFLILNEVLFGTPVYNNFSHLFLSI